VLGDDRRVARLRALAAEVASLPPSGARDDVLRTIRSRLVTEETGSRLSSAWRAKQPSAEATTTAAITAQLGPPRRVPDQRSPWRRPYGE